MKAVRVLTGRGVPLRRSDVDTDQIIPSDWLKRVERTGFGKGLFSEWRDDRSFVLNDEVYAGASILVAGPNFGTGSSREHAVWAIMDYGFDAVISPRFGEIFRNNCTKNGVVPIVPGPFGARVARAFTFAPWSRSSLMKSSLAGPHRLPPRPPPPSSSPSNPST